ncbi:MAG: 16S rRNA (cytidine(1402)-2'-O)-methyltransferase [Clostridia bacterium]|nr:16S rRNA (cytidine(1402)-2'-O)-methyltransferase [Clostridia bacterium]
MKGTLYIVATPIGNLQDFSFRAVEVLKMVDIIACEDTKHSMILLNAYNIKNKLISYHKFNEKGRLDKIKEMLDSGKNVALISDAGTPLISDPGFTLIQQLQNEDYNITTVPGACAFVNALVLSGLDTTRFYFFGFLNGNTSKQVEDLSKIKDLESTLIFYISPHSLQKDIETISKVLGNRQARLVNEITKIYEKVIKFNLCEDIDFNIKGECVLVVEGNKKDNELNSLPIKEHINYYINMGIDEKNALKMVAKDRKISKSEVYKENLK